MNLSYHSESIPTFLSAALSKNNIDNGENIDREALKKLGDMFKLSFGDLQEQHREEHH